ncbi:hypothetical protein PUN28_014167 [Cardiocondyla obscurior]|uniref:Uncharacterized protein n=1 Tax=Cardiocondyla obscurior TaxID=286306 RepID=A0AAW2F2Z2_9HYME
MRATVVVTQLNFFEKAKPVSVKTTKDWLFADFYRHQVILIVNYKCCYFHVLPVLNIVTNRSWTTPFNSLFFYNCIHFLIFKRHSLVQNVKRVIIKNLSILVELI